MSSVRASLCLSLVLVPSLAAAQDAGTDGDSSVSPDRDSSVNPDAGVVPGSGRRSNDWTAFPLVSYANETHLALGGFGAYFFRLGGAPVESRPSYVAAALTYTTRNQVLADIFPELWWDRERWLLTGQLSYWRFPDSFFGLGNNTRAEDEERFLFHAFLERFDLRYRAYRSIFVGLRQEFQYFQVLDPIPTGFFARGGVPGQNGGLRSGGGPMLVIDSRDNTLAPRFGLYYLATLLTFQPWLGSDYAYTRFTLDARQYYTLRDRHTFALQLYASFSDGDVPFNALGLIGGKVLLRGYFEGRFRDRNMFLAQAEYRLMPLIWRFGLVAFAGIAEVAPRLADFTLDGIHWTVGGGIRFALNPAERINIRFDVGLGPDTWGLYANVLEVF